MSRDRHGTVRANSNSAVCTIQQQILDEEKSKHIGLAQQNAFSTSKMLRLAKRHYQSLKPAGDWLDGSIGPGGLYS